MRRAVFEPAGMTQTRDDDPRAIIPNRARSYVIDGGELKNSRWADMSIKMAAGGWVTTASDLVRFMDAWMAGRLVSQPTMKTMLEAYRLRSGVLDDFGLGWFIDDYHGMKAGRYGGSTAQVSAIIFLFPRGRSRIPACLTLKIFPAPSESRSPKPLPT